MSKLRGFTLIEMMITVIILAVVAMIAIPQYQDFVRKARRVAGQEAAIELQGFVDRFWVVNNRYPTGVGEIPPTLLVSPKQGTPAYTLELRQNGFFSGGVVVTITRIIATPVGDQLKDKSCDKAGRKYHIDAKTGAKGPAGCW